MGLSYQVMKLGQPSARGELACSVQGPGAKQASRTAARVPSFVALQITRSNKGTTGNATNEFDHDGLVRDILAPCGVHG